MRFGPGLMPMLDTSLGDQCFLREGVCARALPAADLALLPEPRLRRTPEAARGEVRFAGVFVCDRALPAAVLDRFPAVLAVSVFDAAVAADFDVVLVLRLMCYLPWRVCLGLDCSTTIDLCQSNVAVSSVNPQQLSILGPVHQLRSGILPWTCRAGSSEKRRRVSTANHCRTGSNNGSRAESEEGMPEPSAPSFRR